MISFGISAPYTSGFPAHRAKPWQDPHRGVELAINYKKTEWGLKYGIGGNIIDCA